LEESDDQGFTQNYARQEQNY